MSDRKWDQRSELLRQIFGANSQHRDFGSFWLGYTSGFLSSEQLQAAWESWLQHLAELDEHLRAQEEAQIAGWEARPQD